MLWHLFHQAQIMKLSCVYCCVLYSRSSVQKMCALFKKLVFRWSFLIFHRLIDGISFFFILLLLGVIVFSQSPPANQLESILCVFRSMCFSLCVRFYYFFSCSLIFLCSVFFFFFNIFRTSTTSSISELNE